MFCAIRQQFTSARPATPLQRRYFSPTTARLRPSSAGVAPRYEEVNTHVSSSRTVPRPIGGWRPNTAARELTSEEQALREVLSKRRPDPPPIRTHQNETVQRLPENRDRRVAFRIRTQGLRPGPQRERGWPTAQNTRASNQRQEVEGGGDNAKVVKHATTQPVRFDGVLGTPGVRAQRRNALHESCYGTNYSAERGNPNHRSNQIAQQSAPTWNCPSCGYSNYPREISCRKCRSSKSPPSTETTPTRVITNYRKDGNARYENKYTQSRREPELQSNTRLDGEEALRAEGWKHVRRRVTTTQEPKGQSTQQIVDPPAATNDTVRATAAGQESLARIEQTRDGRFVGLRSGSSHTRPEFAKNTKTPEYDLGEKKSNPTNSVPQASTQSKPSNGWVRWEPSSIESQTGIELDSKESAQPIKQSPALQGWEYPVDERDHLNEPSPSSVFARSASVQEHQEQRDPYDDMDTSNYRTSSSESVQTASGKEMPEGNSKTRSEMSFDPSFEETIDSQPSRRNERRTRNSQARAKASGIEITSVPLNRNRNKERKSKAFVSSIDEFEEDEDIRADRKAQRRQQRERAKALQKAAAPPTPIYLPEFISVSNLAGVLRVRTEDFICKMQELGFAETNNDHVLDAETAGLVAAEFNFEPIIERTEDQDLLPRPAAEDKAELPPRPPVVTIMGHVDHGKTTLLDYLRKSSVAANEHGGITQHIGAFSVLMPGGRLVTFLDTPGHEAFLSMRQRGANVTDIVILVVAADDSVKPQTIEAIKHAQAAKVPMIVAVTKIDKEDSNVDRVKQDLARYSVEIEDYGGDTQVVCVSGKTGQGMGELEDAAVALADILDMRSETDGQAEGWVLEATTKKAGRVATVLVRRGTLRPGDVIIAGTSWARVRSLRNEAGAMVTSAGPGTPVEIDGWREQPIAGDEVLQAPDEQKAKSVIVYRLEASERTKLAADMEAVNESRRLEQEKREQLEKAAELAASNPEAAPSQNEQSISTSPTFQEVFFVIKADVSGSVEAVTNSVSALGNSEVHPHILRSGIGPITEFDIDHAAVANGHIINFNTAIDGQIARMAESKGVGIIGQSIIYRLVDDVRAKLSEKLPDVTTQRVLGEAEIAQVFGINTKGRITVPVAGCKVRNGVVSRTAKIRVLRDKDVVFDGMPNHPSCSPQNMVLLTVLILGALSSLKNVKKDVAEMRKGNECGMSFENWTAFKVGDQVQAYEESVEKRTL